NRFLVARLMKGLGTAKFFACLNEPLLCEFCNDLGIRSQPQQQPVPSDHKLLWLRYVLREEILVTGVERIIMLQNMLKLRKLCSAWNLPKSGKNFFLI